MSSSIVLKYLGVSDIYNERTLNAVRALLGKTEPSKKEVDSQNLTYFITTDGNTPRDCNAIVVAQDKNTNTIVGFGSILFVHRLTGPIAVVQHLVVSDSAKGKGVEKKIFNHLSDKIFEFNEACFADKVKEIQVDLSPQNASAVELAKDLGIDQPEFKNIWTLTLPFT